MDLVFAPLEVAAVAVAAGIAALIALDGESNWLEGAVLTGRLPDLGHQLLLSFVSRDPARGRHRDPNHPSEGPRDARPERPGRPAIEPGQGDPAIEPGQPDPDEAPPVPADVLATPDEGLEPRPQPGKRVLILGGGVAGLVAAFELKRQGHDPLILEAQHRVGGRVQTLRQFAPGLYAEAGAMRIPRVHDLTLAYCDLFGLEMRPFVMGNPSTLVFIDGQRMTVAEADREPERLPFDLADHEKGRTWTELWNEATREFRERYEAGGVGSLDDLLREYDQYSIREFLVARGFSEGALELYGVMSFREANMNAAVVEQLREIVGRSFEDMQEIAGGMDLLPRAFYAELARTSASAPRSWPSSRAPRT